MKSFLSAQWKYLLMLNYEVEPQILSPFVPQGTELDSWNGTTYVSMVGFLFLNTRLKGIPIPFHQNFEEINLRFYVKRETGNELRRGVVFIKEIVPKYAIAKTAQLIYNENYVCHQMDSEINIVKNKNVSNIIYSWISQKQKNYIEGSFAYSEAYLPQKGSQAEYISEHYWGYVSQTNQRTMEYRVEHPQWQVWPVKTSRFECDIENMYGRTFVECLSRKPQSAFIAEGSDITVYQGSIIN